MGERIGTVVPRVSGGFLCAGDSGIYSFDPQTGNKKLIADPEAENDRITDLMTESATLKAVSGQELSARLKRPAMLILYMLDKNGDLSLKIPGVTNSNGICWNAEATQMFYIDTPTKEIRAYPYDNL